MLYQKHLTCHFFTPPTSSLQDLNPSSPLSSSPSISPQEMECVERALKGSFRKELKLNHQHQLQFSCLDEGYACNKSGIVSAVEDFFVDDLLDLSTMSNPKEESLPQEDSKEEFEKSKTCPVQNSVQSNNLSPKQDFISTELAVPEDDVVEDLEWLSHFVEDSFSEYSLTASLPTKKETEPEAGLTPPVRGKARSKRARKIRPAMGWCLGSEDSSITTSSSTSSTSSPTSAHLLIYCNTANNSDSTVGPHEKRREDKKQKRGHAGKPGNGIVPLPRRCSHCGVQKTPQWRAGPLGAKTLCNACGVRFKSGRLLPEYRPACSPTFSSDLHSNHHRKVLEMRRQKENELPESGLAQAVQSF